MYPAKAHSLVVGISAGTSDRTGPCRGTLSRQRSEYTLATTRAPRRNQKLHTTSVCCAVGARLAAAVSARLSPATIQMPSLASARKRSRYVLSTPQPAILWQLGKRCQGRQGNTQRAPPTIVSLCSSLARLLIATSSAVAQHAQVIKAGAVCACDSCCCCGERRLPFSGKLQRAQITDQFKIVN
jgi:hypothetical protein